jgi:hypothetical protein
VSAAVALTQQQDYFSFLQHVFKNFKSTSSEFILPSAAALQITAATQQGADSANFCTLLLGLHLGCHWILVCLL